MTGRKTKTDADVMAEAVAELERAATFWEVLDQLGLKTAGKEAKRLRRKAAQLKARMA